MGRERGGGGDGVVRTNPIPTPKQNQLSSFEGIGGSTTIDTNVMDTLITSRTGQEVYQVDMFRE